MYDQRCRWITAIIFALGAIHTAAAQEFDLSWYTFDAGGISFSEGGGHELVGSMGPPVANSAEMAGGGYELVGGFWNVQIAIACIGDIEGDRDVDLQDMAFLLAHFGQTSGATFADGDVEGDGDVDLQDLAFLLANFGTVCP